VINKVKVLETKQVEELAFFLFTDDFWRDYNQMVERKVKFITEPSVTNYGTVAIFEDLYGNLWDFIEPSKTTS